MLLMGNEKNIDMKTTCNKFSISLYNAMMLLMGKEKHINMRRAEIDIYDQLYNDVELYNNAVDIHTVKKPEAEKKVLGDTFQIASATRQGFMFCRF